MRERVPSAARRVRVSHLARTSAMPIRTGKEFLDGLHDDRQIFMEGERITDVTTDRRFAGAARSLAELFDMQHDPALAEQMPFKSPSSGEPVERQEKDLAAKIVKETDAGIVIKGARMVSTLCAYSDDILVMPSTVLATNAEAAPYAFGFSIPVATKGLRFICRPSVVHQNSASAMDYPLSSRLDEGDGLAVFDNVLVPWERVFIHRDPEMCNGLFQRTQAMPQVMHQTATKNLAKAEFMMALGFAIARSTNIDAHLHVQGMLAELIQHAEFVRSCIRASEADAAPSPSGLMTPAEMPLWTVRMMFPKMFVRACEIIQILGAGGLVAVPSYAELSGPAAADVAMYAQAANADAPSRVKLFRLAFDAAVSSFSGRQQLYERYYSGDPVRLAGALYAMYPKDAPVARIHQMLNQLEAR